ncbi:hypothetical protein JZ751_029396 [Albula glossodonta]|uniref:Uncharacterized protein n=1 Tax=Albula glossodonta TaxID=121402 RepID=A0A8T2PJJ2_9TELE|nr:hypothetical protein JZ751_029396 [Albula glossodonta]
MCAERLGDGYRIRLGSSTDKKDTGRLHVDFAQARDDLYEWECRQRMLAREERHRRRIEEDRLRPPSPPPIVHYSEHECSQLGEKIKVLQSAPLRRLRNANTLIPHPPPPATIPVLPSPNVPHPPSPSLPPPTPTPVSIKMLSKKMILYKEADKHSSNKWVRRTTLCAVAWKACRRATMSTPPGVRDEARRRGV